MRIRLCNMINMYASYSLLAPQPHHSRTTPDTPNPIPILSLTVKRDGKQPDADQVYGFRAVAGHGVALVTVGEDGGDDADDGEEDRHGVKADAREAQAAAAKTLYASGPLIGDAAHLMFRRLGTLDHLVQRDRDGDDDEDYGGSGCVVGARAVGLWWLVAIVITKCQWVGVGRGGYSGEKGEGMGERGESGEKECTGMYEWLDRRQLGKFVETTFMWNVDISPHPDPRPDSSKDTTPRNTNPSRQRMYLPVIIAFLRVPMIPASSAHGRVEMAKRRRRRLMRMKERRQRPNGSYLCKEEGKGRNRVRVECGSEV